MPTIINPVDPDYLLRGNTYKLREFTGRALNVILTHVFSGQENESQEHLIMRANLLTPKTDIAGGIYGIGKLIFLPDVSEILRQDALTPMPDFELTASELIDLVDAWIKRGDLVGLLKKLQAVGGLMRAAGEELLSSIPNDGSVPQS